MEIAQAMVEKANAEAAISKLLEQLGLNTGLKIEDVNIRAVHYTIGCGPRIQVEIDMRLI